MTAPEKITAAPAAKAAGAAKAGPAARRENGQGLRPGIAF
jgi:hypothetical protein